LTTTNDVLKKKYLKIEGNTWKLSHWWRDQELERLLRIVEGNARNAVIWDVNWEIQDVMTKDCA